MSDMPETLVQFSDSEKQLLQTAEKPSEERGTLTPDLLELARSKKLYHLAVPKELGGAELPVPSLIGIFEEASFLNGSFGWNLTLGAGAGIFGAYMDPGFAREVFADPKAFITGSGYPAGRAQRTVDGSFLASGLWKYASGSPYATLFTASCWVAGSDADSPDVIALAFYPGEVKRLGTWNSYGLTATASHDFEVVEQQIPKRRSFKMVAQPEYAGKALYRFPFMPFACATLAASLLGITRAFIDEAGPDHAHLSASVLAHRTRLHETVQSLWESCKIGEPVSEDEASSVQQAAVELAGVCRTTAFALYQACGMKVLDRDSRLNRTWRDLMTAGQHAMLQNTGA
ncbi:MAG TPA: hypothetical protein VJ915_06745 [Balneolaceae bacterium]|nr:hypothetical protein [Balneolaceae bacterium]